MKRSPQTAASRLHSAPDRRQAFGLVVGLGMGLIGDVAAQSPANRIGSSRDASHALREMQIHTVSDLGLEIWVENQPPWSARLEQHNGRPLFTVQSPDNYHPPTAMTYASWPEHPVADNAFIKVAESAVIHGARNFGLGPGDARALNLVPASHGSLVGVQSTFIGRERGLVVDARIFVGQQSGRYPVALTVYTLKGKFVHLEQVVRRSWGNLAYLA